jgi:AraC-like DNA-binding protein
LGAYLTTHALVHPELRLHAVRNANVVSEDALLLRAFHRAGAVGRPIVTILLDGLGTVRAYDREARISAGELLAMDYKGAIAMRQEGARYEALAFEWEPALLGPRPGAFLQRRLASTQLARARAIWSAIVHDESTPEDLVVALVRLVGECAHELRVPTADELDDPVLPSTARMARALDVALSNLEGQPMTADLEKLLGLSARQVNRLVHAFNARYGFNSVGWRDTRNRRRLMMGATFMTAPRATVAQVAKIVGYRSPTAFARALADAGLPPPRAIPEVVRDLGVPARISA